MITRDLQSLIDGLSGFVAAVSPEGIILATNENWGRNVERLDVPQFQVGSNYIAAMAALTESGDRRAPALLKAFHEVGNGVRQAVRCLYVGWGPLSGNDFNVTFSGMESGGIRTVLISAQDMTELNELKDDLRRSHGKVLKAQERERREVARELHDSTAQILAALNLNLINFRTSVEGTGVEKTVADCKSTVDELLQEIRSISFLAHPPELLRQGLTGAIRSLCSGFAARTGLSIDLQIADIGEASRTVEATLYRLAQEALAAIHRHPRAGHASMQLLGTRGHLSLIIADDGAGFEEADLHSPMPLGVGVMGMEERLKELGGSLLIRRTQAGTTVTATLPRHKGSNSYR
jgi:signal transduction histidine kinase